VTSLTRRQLLLRAVPLGLAGFALSRGAGAAGSCVQAESESLAASLNYTSASPDVAVACAHCAFFTASASGGACGACKILGGPVDSTGHCDSFSPPT
jgi:hypothetical protein